MGLRIQNNISAMNAHKNLQIADSGMSKSLERLSSGYRINSAKDDAAGLSISQGFRADIASYKVASRNTAEANSLLQVAEGAIDQIGNMLTRLKELATQAASANSGSNLDKINSEGNKLINEIDRIANSTEYAGTKLLNGSFGVTLSTGTFTAGIGYGGVEGLQSGKTYTIATASASATTANITISATLAGGRVSQTVYGVTAAASGETKELSFEALGLKLTINDHWTEADASSSGTLAASTATASNFQVGAKNTSNDQIGVLIGSATSSTMSLTSDQLLTAANALTFMGTIDAAIGTLSSTRGDIGAAQNRLGYAAANLATTIENTQAAESVIRDVDMAAEMTTFTKNQILLQAGTSMLAQANMAPQGVLSLLQ
ncbi:MAG: flagellin [Desulfobacterium sp.]|nr:flagellin [Desulfobacterium sp.]MBU3949766.1 flagellin [Pseudomonadota bacterium]MBU4010060.1 flagellin [Pseudomonadota bacterium]MBU4037987.1 flagellin [Pseudomonadota bacterium]